MISINSDDFFNITNSVFDITKFFFVISLRFCDIKIHFVISQFYFVISTKILNYYKIKCVLSQDRDFLVKMSTQNISVSWYFEIVSFTCMPS